MLEKGIMKPSESLWSSDVFLVKNKDGNQHFA